MTDVNFGEAGRQEQVGDGVESQLRRGAGFCRRVALITLVIGFVGSLGMAVAFGRGFADGLSPQALLAVMAGSILGLLLVVVLFFMVARTMEGLAALIATTARLGAVGPAPVAGGERAAGSGTGEAEAEETTGAGDAQGTEPGVLSPTGPEPATLSRPPAEVPTGRPALVTQLVEHIRMGHLVKVTTSDGWSGWIRDSDLPPAAPAPQRADGRPCRLPGPSLSPGRASHSCDGGEGDGSPPPAGAE
jgi:hypothetical protein